MTTTNAPVTGAVACRPPLAGPRLREVFPVPPVLRLADVGAFCSLDDTVLAREVDCWSCPACGAAWNHAGRDGWWPITPRVDLVDTVDDVDPGRSRRVRVAVVAAGAAGPAVATVPLARRYAEHADAVPDLLLYSPVAALGLVAAVVAGQWVLRWVDERRHPLAVDVDKADLDPYGRELLAQVRARSGEAC